MNEWSWKMIDLKNKNYSARVILINVIVIYEIYYSKETNYER